MQIQTTTAPKIANYRIYDRTGSGVTEDIYAESLEDAIEQGRDWIEAGDWEQGDDEEQLECEVGEIIYTPDLEPIESALTEYAVSYEDGRIVTHITAADLAAGDLDKIAAELADIATVGTVGTDADGDTVIVITPLAALDMIEDEGATWESDRHDCSGTLPAKDAPECIDGDSEGHDWRSPYSVLGGCKENPGVWGSGHGQVMIKYVCACCGAYKSTDYGATNSSNGQQCTRTSYEDADEASKAWLMRRLNPPEEIELKGLAVSLEWDKTADITDEDAELGRAIHTVSSDDLDAGTADGPNDGETFEHEGIKFRLGSHDYETEDGRTTCIASIYRAL